MNNKIMLWILLAALLLVSANTANALKTENLIVNFSMNPETPKVGIPTDIHFTVRNATTNVPVENVKASMNIRIPEDNLSVFSGVIHSKTGNFNMLYHFQDATTYAIKLTIYPTSSSIVQFKPVEKVIETTVTPPDPPTKIWIKTWSFLIGLLITGIGIGYFSVKKGT